MFERTSALLGSGSVVQCDDSCFAFGYGANPIGTAELDAELGFFGAEFFAPSISGCGGHTLNVTRDALREIERNVCRRMVVYLLQNDFRMFSVRPVRSAALEQLADAFMEDMGECSCYTNTAAIPDSRGDCASASWLPVTRSTCDILVCAANARYVAYWVYSDDE